MTFNVEIVLKGRDFAVTEAISVAHGEPATWNEAAVRAVLVEILRAIDRVQNPGSAPNRAVALRGFSWIVEPAGEGVRTELALAGNHLVRRAPPARFERATGGLEVRCSIQLSYEGRCP